MENSELKKYLPIVQMIGDSFGKNCEVVLHDLTAPQKSVVFVYNNTVTGREVGQSFDHLIKDVLLSPDLYDDYRSNYTFTLENGKRIKSSTSLIRNNDGRVIGALCINFDITAFENISSVLSDFFLPKTGHAEDAFPGSANISNVNQILDDLLESILSDVDNANISRKKRLDLITFMDTKGVFLVKGAVEKVAAKMNISTVTVYSYLDEVRKKVSEKSKKKI